MSDGVYLGYAYPGSARLAIDLPGYFMWRGQVPRSLPAGQQGVVMHMEWGKGEGHTPFMSVDV
jgi:hypothetical protein